MSIKDDVREFVSADYYVRLERGNLAGVSEQVLDALARALQLDEAETLPPVRPRPSLHRPGPRLAPSRGHQGSPRRAAHPRIARHAGLRAQRPHGHPRGQRRRLRPLRRRPRPRPPAVEPRSFPLPRPAPQRSSWTGRNVADDAVAALRAEAGRNPHDGLTNLIGELATRSEEFRTRWARHNVKHHRTSAKRLHNSLVGDIQLTGEAMELAGDGLVVITYTAEPDNPAAEALRFLASGLPSTPTSQPNAQTPPETHREAAPVPQPQL